jgi:hypothetical protein
MELQEHQDKLFYRDTLLSTGKVPRRGVEV